MANQPDMTFLCPACEHGHSLYGTRGNERLVIACACGKKYEIRVAELVPQDSPYPIRQVGSWPETHYDQTRQTEVNRG
jgi:transcription elongation factor Elf1